MAAAIPLVATGISAIQGIGAQRKAGQQQQQQQQFAAQQGANSSALFAQGMPALNQASSYYSRLLTGSRAGMTQAVQPEIGATTDIYRGAERNLERSGVRGAQRDVAKADLARDQAGRIANLIGGVRPMAAQQLAGIGQNQISAAQGFGGLTGQLQGQAQQTKQYNDSQSQALWGQIGKLLVGGVDAWKNRNVGASGAL